MPGWDWSLARLQAEVADRLWRGNGLWAAVSGQAARAADALAVWPAAAAVLRRLLALPSLRRAVGASAAATSEHARRLTSVKANGKFAQVGADDTWPWEVRLAATVAE